MFEPPFNGVVLDDVAQVLSTLREANADLAVDHRLVSVSKKQSVDETHQWWKSLLTVNISKFRAGNPEGIRRGKKMIREFEYLLREIKDIIVPVGTKGLDKLLDNTVHIRIKLTGAVAMEWRTGERIERSNGPDPASGMSAEEMSAATNTWVYKTLHPHLQRWSEDLTRRVLPKSFESLAMMAGTDLEKFLVTERGQCNVCYRPAGQCPLITTEMLHMHIGTGMLIVTIDGMSPNEIVEEVAKPKAMVPEDAKVVAPTSCEFRQNPAATAMMKVLTDLLISETSTDLLLVAFSAATAERKDLPKFLSDIGLGRVGIRVAESSAFECGSVSNAVLYPYGDKKDNEPKKNCNAHICWITGRSVPQDLWMDQEVQANFSLRRVKPRSEGPKKDSVISKHMCMALLYHHVDDVGPLCITYVALVKFIVSHPLILLLGFENFVSELVMIVLETLGRVSTQERVWYKAQNAKLPDTIEEVFKVVDGLHRLTVQEKIIAYGRGAFHLFGVQGQMHERFVLNWVNSTCTPPKRQGEVSTPDVAVSTGHGKKKKGFNLNNGECFVDVGGSGARMIVDQRMAKSMSNFEIGGGRNGSATTLGSNSGATVSISEKRPREASIIEEPARKKFVVADNESNLRVGGAFNHGKVQEMIAKLPSLTGLVKSVETDKTTITQADYDVILQETYNKVADVVVNTNVVRITATNDVEAAARQKEINDESAKLTGLRERIRKRKDEIQQLQALQLKDKQMLKEREAVIKDMVEVEEKRRKRFLENSERERKKKINNAYEGAQMFVSATRTRLEESKSVYSPVEPTVINSLKKQMGKASSQPTPELLKNWAGLSEYDVLRSQVIITSATIEKIMRRKNYVEALERFNKRKEEPDVKGGNLSGMGQLLNDLVRADVNGPRSWSYCYNRMRILQKMKKIVVESRNKVPEVLWTDEQISAAKDKGAKLRYNLHVRAQALVEDLAKEFSKAVKIVTGEELEKTEIWYFDESFQRSYEGTFKKGIVHLTREAARRHNNVYEADVSGQKARSKLEALLTVRQTTPIHEEESNEIAKCFKEVERSENDEVEPMEEDNPERNIVEIDYEDEDEYPEPSRKAAHLKTYRK